MSTEWLRLARAASKLGGNMGLWKCGLACAGWLTMSCLLMGQAPRVNRDSVIIKDFESRVTDYVKLSKKAASGPAAPKQTAPAVSSAQPSSLPASTSQLDLRLPLQPKSVRFAVVGDTGTGGSAQYEIAKEMEAYRKLVGFDFVIMLGDNIYGGDSPKNFVRKFELPYKPLLDAGVKFYASLGNHDNPNERLYKLFNMGGERYYTFKKNDVAFFALDSNYMDPQQLSWLEQRLRDSNAAWKICYFH